MVTLYTDRPAYANDLAEVIRAYLGMTEIVLPAAPGPAEGYALSVILGDGATPCARAEGSRYGVPAAAEAAQHMAGCEDALINKREQKRAMKLALYRVLQQLEPETVLPWGALTGIRPTKLLRELMEDRGEVEALRLLSEEFDVRPQKLSLAREIVRVQEGLLEGVTARTVDLYVHIPFCNTRCLYCSFPSVVIGQKAVPEEYLKALAEEIRAGAELVREGGYRVRCTYIGGGTPTTLSADQLTALLDCIGEAYGGFGRELTVEAGRPDSLDEEKLQALRAAGVNRISLNPQTMNGETLRRIGREHTPEDIMRVYRLTRETGFTNINMDIIAGLPGEGKVQMRKTLDALLPLAPDNLTVHTLAVKRSSRLKERMEEYPLPSPEEAERMVTLAAEAAAAMGMRPYYMYRQKYMRGNLENVGYALPGKDCLYNVDMMEEAASILAHGAGAMAKRVFPGRNQRVERLPAPKDIPTYYAKLPALCESKRRLFLEP